MSFVFCLRADGSLFEDVTNAMCVAWLTTVHPTSPPAPGVWSQVPSNLLPDGAAVCYFNASVFMEQVVAPSFATPSADTRPLVTPRMREENRPEWDRLWNLNRTEECPVCHEKPDIWDGPMNSDVPTRCTHWVCVPCWARIANRDKRCPICREDLSAWIRRHDAGRESSESDEGPADPEADGDSQDEEVVSAVDTMVDAPFRHVFLVGDRVRVTPTFGGYAELRGASGTVTHNVADVTVRFDAPVPVIAGLPWQMFTHSPHNFEHFRG